MKKVQVIEQGCPHWKRCGLTGHYLEAGRMHRCTCLQQRLNKEILGVFHTPTPADTSQLITLRKSNVVIEGPLSVIRNHVAATLLVMVENGSTFVTFDAYKLVDIFLEKDEEIVNYSSLVEPDLAIVLLGFAEIANRRLPEMLLQVMSRRELRHKPTWVVLGIPLGQVGTRFGTSVSEKLAEFQKVEIRG